MWPDLETHLADQTVYDLMDEFADDVPATLQLVAAGSSDLHAVAGTAPAGNRGSQTGPTILPSLVGPVAFLTQYEKGRVTAQCHPGEPAVALSADGWLCHTCVYGPER